LRDSVGRYDVIVIDLPIPQNALLARLLSRECFADARRALAPGGIFALATPGIGRLLDPARRQRHASLLATLAAFSRRGRGPRRQTILWAAEKEVDARPGVLAARLDQRGLHLAQVGKTWLFDRLLPFHAEDYRRALATALPIENRDFRPVVYLFGLIENLQRFLRAGPGRAGAARSPWAPWSWRPWCLARLLWLFSAGAVDRLPASRSRPRAPRDGLAVGLAARLSSLRGHLYHALGGLLAGFMAGMAAGALAAGRFLDRPRVLARACAGAAAARGSGAGRD
jgi:hypothetical protein